MVLSDLIKEEPAQKEQTNFLLALTYISIRIGGLLTSFALGGWHAYF